MVKHIIIFLTLIFYIIKAELVEIPCPERCNCEMVENLKKASCTHKNIYSIEINMHPDVDIFDISSNYINSLGPSTFQNNHLTNLKLLNISNNALANNIHMDAFNGLVKLKTLDLSNNRIGVIMKIWLKDMSELKELYLSGNYLNRMGNEPPFESKSLKVLDLNNCGIDAIEPDLFDGVPNLEYLDLSRNHLMKMPNQILFNLKKLTFFSLDDTRIECNKMFMSTIDYLKNRDVIFKTPCKKIDQLKTGQKFQKMIMDPSIQKNSWIFDENSDVKIIEVCNNSITPRNETYLLRVVKISPPIVLASILAYGILTGLTLGCICANCSCSCKKRSKDWGEEVELESSHSHSRTIKRRSFLMPSKRYRSNGNILNYETNIDKESLLESAWDAGISTPQQIRRVMGEERKDYA
ncbi:unnamed protein product [Brassicogethes aeneus]|uniref:Uncharacterized protein n=1 Tax=Brassicogethes aeneus TaxID=1431903 RepID=A0A9P0BF00_BRAAE|nr:unnamed protein product [Brassicogethes aeneus]